MHPEKQFRRKLPEWHKAGAGGPLGAESTDWLSPSPPCPAHPQLSRFRLQRALLLHSPPDPLGPLPLPTVLLSGFLPAQLLEGWRELSRKRCNPEPRGPRRLHGTPAELLCVRICETGTEENHGIPDATPAGLSSSQVPRAGPPPQLLIRDTGRHTPATRTTSFLLLPRAHRAITELSLSEPASSLITTTPSWPRQPPSRTTGVSRIHGGGRNTARAIFPTGVRRLTPSQDLTATVSQYSRAPRVASYPAPNPTAWSRALRPLLTLPMPAFYQPLDFPQAPSGYKASAYLSGQLPPPHSLSFFFNLFQYSTENIVNIP